MTPLKFENNKLTPYNNESPTAAFLSLDAFIAGASGDKLDIAVEDDLAHCSLDLENITQVRLHFPVYRDGRAFSQARLLRGKHQYKGDIWASGDVLHDQILLMVRCGFTGFDVKKTQTIADLNKALSTFSNFYQHAEDGLSPIWAKRHQSGTYCHA